MVAHLTKEFVHPADAINLHINLTKLIQGLWNTHDILLEQRIMGNLILNIGPGGIVSSKLQFYVR